MRTAIYTEAGVTQVVFTPESDFEKQALASLVSHKGNFTPPEPVDATIRRGSFYECQGGWTRFNEGGDESIIVRLVSRPPEGPPP